MAHDPLYRFDTAFGVCALGWTERGITRLRLPNVEQDIDAATAVPNGDVATEELPSDIAACIARLHTYFSGAVIDFTDVTLDFGALAPESATIYRALRGVGWGETTTYGALATAIGTPGGARAVGVAMARNPWPVIVPCHRVLASGGRLGGFSAPGGSRTKERLLALEHVRAGDSQPLLPGIF